jgi:nitrogen fixation NifU-like protein
VEDEVLRLAFEGGDAQEDELDGIFAGVGVEVALDLAGLGVVNGEFLFELAGERLFWRFAGFDFTAGEFPFEGMRLGGGALADEDFAVAFEDRRHHLKHANIGTLMYSERLLDHFQNPRNVGELGPPAVTVEVSNPACGDILRLSVLFEGERVAEARYKVRGCTASIAAGSALTEWLVGRSRRELGEFRAGVIEEALGGLANESKHAGVLCLDGVRAVVKRS